MIRILIVIQLVCAALLLATCERSNMYDLAKYGLPPQSVIYIYSINTQMGNLGGRNNADSLCYKQGIVYHTFVKAGTVKAFISISAIDEIRFLVPVQYWHYPVIGISPGMFFNSISSTWLDLWVGTSVAPINAAVGIGASNWWSGSNSDGSATIDGTCSEWHNLDTVTTGNIGGIGVSSGSSTCDVSQYVLCVAY